MSDIYFTQEELNFLHDAVLAVKVAGTVEDVVNGRMVLTDLASGVLRKLSTTSTDKATTKIEDQLPPTTP